MKDDIGIQEVIHNVCHGRASEKKGDVVVVLPIYTMWEINLWHCRDEFFDN